MRQPAAIALPLPACIDCRFWRGTTEDAGQCRRRAPQPGKTLWAVTAPTDFCGEGERTITEPPRHMDSPFQRWLDARCKLAEPGAALVVTASRDLYEDFRDWCAAAGLTHVMSATSFGRALGEIGRDATKINGNIFRVGIALKVMAQAVAHV